MVSFVIPLYNCLAHTQECLRTLRDTLPEDLEREVIFVDDGSTDGTRAWLSSLPSASRNSSAREKIVVILNPSNAGFAASCNRGARSANGETIFFLNNDLVLLRGWFQPMFDLVSRRAQAAVVGNVQLSAADKHVDHAGVIFTHKAKPEHETRRPWLSRLAGERAVPAVTGACFAIRRAVWNQLGGFDEEYRNGGEDIDLCLRAQAEGYTNYVVLRSIVLHHVSQSAGRKVRDEQNSRRLTERWRTQIAFLSARAWARHHLETAWHGARDPGDFASAARLLFLSLGILRRPSLAAVCGADRAIETEIQRWREMFDGVPPVSVDTSIRTAEI